MLNKYLLPLVSLCLVVALVGCSRQKEAVSEQVAKPSSEDRFRPIGLDVDWFNDAMKLAAGEKVKQVWLEQKSIYCLTSLNKLYRLDREEGAIRWILELAEPPRVVLRPAEAGDKTLVVSHNVVQVYELESGNFIKELALEFSANSDPAFNGRNLFIADSAGGVVAIELATGLRLWSCRAERAISAQPVYLGRLLVAASESGEVLAYDTESGEMVWPDHFPTRAAVLARPVLTERACYVASMDSRLYCLRSSGGDELWRYFARKGLRVAPKVADGRVFLPVPDKGLVVLDAANGEELKDFQFADGKQYIGRVKERLYVLSEHGQIVSVDAQSGERLAEAPAGDFDFFLGDDRAGRIYLANAEGRIICLQELGTRLRQFQP